MMIPNLEEYVLGSWILEGKTRPLIGRTNLNWFTNEQNRTIATAIFKLYMEGKPIDLVTIYREVKPHKITAIQISQLTTQFTGAGDTKEYLFYLECEYKERMVRLTMQQLLNGNKDIAVIRADMLKVLDDLANTNFKGTAKMSVALANAIDQVIETSKSGTGLMGKRTGWRFLDKYIGGYNEGELIIIAGRPGMGKTAFAMTLGIDFAKLGNKVLFFSLEMSTPQLAKRIISHESDIPNYKVRNGQLSQDDIDKVLNFYNRLSFDFHIDDTAGISIDSIRAKAAEHKNQHGLDLLIVDYIQLVQGSGQNREQEIASISRGLKLISKESSCTVIGLAQLSRAVEHRQDKRPFMSDLRESGAIEQDADVVMFPYRPAYYEQGPRQEFEDDAEIIIGKNRNGETCYAQVCFIGSQTKYKEI